MRIAVEQFPYLEQVRGAGMDPNPDTTVFTFGDVVYNPGGVPIAGHLLAHEERHSAQQGGTEGGARAWWDRYLSDQWFRIEQEAEAYASQYDFVCLGVRDRNARARFLWRLAAALSGPTYGNVIGWGAAQRMIKEKSKNR